MGDDTAPDELPEFGESSGQPQQERGPSRLKAALLALAVLLVACICLGAIGALLGNGDDEVADEDTPAAVADQNDDAEDEDQAEATATSTPAPTNTTIPTDTPAPTDTSMPTDTPAPTSTATPTSSPTGTPTTDAEVEAEAGYREWASGIAEQYTDGLDSFGEQNQALSEDITLLNDDEWVIETAAAVAVIQNASEQVITYDEDIPERYQPVHEEFVRAAELYSNSMDAYVEGIDEVDPDKLDEAFELMTEANAAIGEATSLMQQIEN